MFRFRALAAVVAVLLQVTAATAVAYGQAGEEAAIKKVVETFVTSVNKAELDVMLAQLSDDAKIYSRAAQGQVSKLRYAELMADVFKKGDLVSAEIRDMNVTMADASKAVVLGTVYLVYKSGRPSGRAEYKLEKRDGRWLVVETATR